MQHTEVQIIGHHMVYQPAVVEQHQHIFPELRLAQMPQGMYAAIPHTVDYAMVLKNLGYIVPSPIRTGYNWPGRFKPYDHQLVTAEFLTLNPRCFILSGMGTGKTLSALWAADFLKGVGKIGKTLICSPLSTLERVWGDEIFINFPHRKFAVLHGSRQRRLDLLATEADYYIINHDGIEVIAEALASRPDIDHIIIDELAVFRNSKTKRWKTLKSLITPNRWVWGMTGTPTPNAPTDAYAQCKLIKPDNFNGHFTKFKQITMQQLGMFKWVPRRGCEEIVNQVLKPSLRFALDDCIDLPETIYHDRDAELSPTQRHHYEQLRREAVTTINGTDVQAVNAAVLVSKMVQAASGVVYGGGSKIELDFGPRLGVLTEAIEESDGKIIVFVPFTGVLDALYSKLSEHWSCAVIDGGVSSGKRDQIFRDFMEAANPRILIANPGTMAHGLTLTAATTIVWYAPIYSNELYEQANARIKRPGQKKVTNIVHIAATSLERKIYGVLRERGRLQGVVLDLAKGGK